MDNKNIFAKNLNYYMAINGKTRRELCSALGFSYSTVSEWINGKKYPRMDKVEELARYFGINKSDLIEEKLSLEVEKTQDLYIDILVRLQTDNAFHSYVERLMDLEPEKIQVLDEMLSGFHILAK